MIAYVDSSVLARAYLVDEPGHDEARRLVDDASVALITGTWTRVEVSGALVRASHTTRQAAAVLLLLDADLRSDGRIAVVRAAQAAVEDIALNLVRAHPIRAADAWHLAAAQLSLPHLAEGDDVVAFATRDARQGRVAASLGFTLV